MGWSKNYSTLSRHRKIYDLALILKCDRFRAIGLVIAVHNFAVDFEPDGDLSDYDDTSLANQLGWRYRGVGVKTALSRAQLLDKRGIIYRWADHNGSYGNAERQRKRRKRIAAGEPSRDSSATVTPGNGENRVEGEKKENRERVDPGLADEIRAVFAHYKTLHPRKFPKVHSKLKEWEKIKKRIEEDGHDAASLIEAIDGMHKTPHNMGVNDRNQKYLDLELCMRDAKHVEQYRAAAEGPLPQVGLSPRDMRNQANIEEGVRIHEQRKRKEPVRKSLGGGDVRSVGEAGRATDG